MWTLHQLPSGHAAQSRQLGPPFDPASTLGIPAAVVHTYQLRSVYTGKESMAFIPAEALLQLYSILGDMRQLMSLLGRDAGTGASGHRVERVHPVSPHVAAVRHLASVGAPRRYVFAIAWGYTSILVGIGVLGGLAGGYVLSSAVSSWLARATGIALQPRLGASEFLMAAAIFGIGLLLAALPAWRIQHAPLAAAMNGE